jgi:hypothetical protein
MILSEKKLKGNEAQMIVNFGRSTAWLQQQERDMNSIDRMQVVSAVNDCGQPVVYYKKDFETSKKSSIIKRY